LVNGTPQRSIVPSQNKPKIGHITHNQINVFLRKSALGQMKLESAVAETTRLQFLHKMLDSDKSKKQPKDAKN